MALEDFRQIKAYAASAGYKCTGGLVGYDPELTEKGIQVFIGASNKYPVILTENKIPGGDQRLTVSEYGADKHLAF